eukprot:CAMPEP_0204835856 /NCGR_PEP_ID=MMETSP1346-20131115/23831_1 /ASSEMBLY_ACC=CAM_ASM_000771 /TAXON_ID=215587 /ORGANISM="Aplanochytrium stocchinoi, Strain GSBS06" /LENGTH=530 /DNA_ID=CAMNT_0051970217 /DNA_START=225 /DNA_END=1817 /DNA_ORIENTATION=-
MTVPNVESELRVPIIINDGIITESDMDVDVIEGSKKISVRAFTMFYSMSRHYELFFNGLGKEYHFDFSKTTEFINNIGTIKVEEVGFLHPIGFLGSRLDRELVDEYVRCCQGCSLNCSFECPEICKTICFPFFLLYKCLHCIYFVLTCPIQMLDMVFSAIGSLLSMIIGFLITGIVSIIIMILKALLSCTIFAITYLTKCLGGNMRISEDDLARRCRLFAYSCNRSSVCDPKTRLAAKMTGFGLAVDAMAYHMQQNRRVQKTELTYNEIDTVPKIVEKLKSEQQNRNQIEIEAPKAMFRNLFGKNLRIGKTDGIMIFDDRDSMNEAQSRCLTYILSTDDGRYLLEDGVPTKLRSDVSSLLGSIRINFNIKSQGSMSIKFQKKIKKRREKDRYIRDLVRCRVIVSDVHNTWSSLSSQVISNLDSLHCDGIIIKMKEPKVDKPLATSQNGERERSENAADDDAKDQFEWHGLYLFLFYDEIPVEVQVMSDESFLSFGTAISADQRKEREKKERERVNKQIRIEVVPEPPTTD